MGSITMTMSWVYFKEHLWDVVEWEMHCIDVIMLFYHINMKFYDLEIHAFEAVLRANGGGVPSSINQVTI